ncbi:MAG: hypothetical protein M3Q15_00795 [Pseudomonadota bacterium]|nr:hypothetical protein [Pseudomonadota bacterium]
MRKLLVVFLCLAVAGCASAPQPLAAPSPLPFIYDEGSFAVGKEYLTASQTLASTVRADRPRAFVLLAPGKRKANIKVCKAFETLVPVSEVGAGNPDAKVISTYWMVRTASASSTDCASLVDNYDFAKASALRAGYQLPSANGQFILAIDADNRPFYIDITRANAAQRRDAMLVWLATAQTLAAENPGAVITSNNLFDRMSREFCRDVVREVSLGDAVEAATTMSPVAVGRVAINAAGSFFCERRA